MSTFYRKFFYPIVFITLLLSIISCNNTNSTGKFIAVEDVRDQVVSRIIEKVPAENLSLIDDAFVQNFITPDERKVFANNHWRFTVDKPAIISIMRDKNQQIQPFWLLESGFIKTEKIVKNRNYEYEVWQKQVSAGEVGLGINGFDLHRPVYFVTIGPVKNGDMPVITNVYPDKWKRIKMQKGAYTYNDWDELIIEEFPEEMEGHILFTTIRGRAREASIINSFRTTKFPSSSKPDQIILTWSDEPSTSQSIQWRTNTSTLDASVKYWRKNEDSVNFQKATAFSSLLHDVYIYNNPDVKHWEVNIEGLSPETAYNYQIVIGNETEKSPVYTFRTAPGISTPFKFIFIGDTHNNSIVETVIEKAYCDYPDAAFVVHSGDHVNTGLFREQWDEHFHNMKNVLPYVSFVPTLGNHDSQDGLPPKLYQQLFMLPVDENSLLEPERNYTFSYSNTRFYILDSTGDTDSIAFWLENELEKTTEQWKIVVTHFPPYWTDDSYPEKREKWTPLFDKHEVNLVLTGHVHQYFRSYPIFENEPQKLNEKGTTYVTSVAVDSREREESSAKYNKVHINMGALYQIIEIDDNRIHFVSRNLKGDIVDEFRISK